MSSLLESESLPAYLVACLSGTFIVMSFIFCAFIYLKVNGGKTLAKYFTLMLIVFFIFGLSKYLQYLSIGRWSFLIILTEIYLIFTNASLALRPLKEVP